MKSFALTVTLLVAACATKPVPGPQDVFFTNLSALCGKAFEGRLVTSDAADADMRARTLRMHVRDCSPTQVRIPFSVGEDRSRTWIVTRTRQGLRLKHDHRHVDGTPDLRTDYGGDSQAEGTSIRQAFPADADSKALFIAQGIPQSAANIWALDLIPNQAFAYELRRPGRAFRAEFDLTRPLPAD